MKKCFAFLLLPVILLFSACSSAAPTTTPLQPDTTPTETTVATLPSTTPANTLTPEPDLMITPGYPEPGDTSGEDGMELGYPNPSENSSMPLESAPWTAYPPVQSDANLERGEFFVDHIELLPVPGDQGVTGLFVEGSLPTPCHAPRAYVSQPDENNRITVELYTVQDPDRMCTQVIVPFSDAVARFRGLPPGEYQVVVEGQSVGQFTAQ